LGVHGRGRCRVAGKETHQGEVLRGGGTFSPWEIGRKEVDARRSGKEAPSAMVAEGSSRPWGETLRRASVRGRRRGKEEGGAGWEVVARPRQEQGRGGQPSTSAAAMELCSAMEATAPCASVKQGRHGRQGGAPSWGG
jgi:hypothetical protein